GLRRWQSCLPDEPSPLFCATDRRSFAGPLLLVRQIYGVIGRRATPLPPLPRSPHPARMTARYKLLSLADAAVLLDVDEDCFDEAIVPGRVLAYLADTTNRMVVAIDGTKVVGQCAAVIHRHPDR